MSKHFFKKSSTFFILLQLYLHLDFWVHSINNLHLIQKFIAKGQKAFKIDISPIIMADCQKYAYRNDFKIKEVINDELIGCLALLGDFAGAPYAFNSFHTTEDLFEYFKSSDFFEKSKIKKTKFYFQLSFLTLEEINDKSVHLIDFLLKIIEVADRNEYFIPIISRCYPELLDQHCNKNPESCFERNRDFQKIINSPHFVCDFSFYKPFTHRFFNHQHDTLQYHCLTGFGQYYQSKVPLVFWELNQRSSVANFIKQAEFNCPQKRENEIMLASNLDSDFFRKIVNYDILTPNLGDIYTKVQFEAGQNMLIGQIVIAELDLIVHLSTSSPGTFNFQFISLSTEGKTNVLNNLKYSNEEKSEFIGMQYFERYLISFFKESVLIHSISRSGAVHYLFYKIPTEYVKKHVSLKDYKPKTGQIDFLTTDLPKNNLINSFLVRCFQSECKTIDEKSFKLPIDTQNSKNVIFYKNEITKEIFFGFDTIINGSIITILSRTSWENDNSVKIQKYVGSLSDFQVDFTEGLFVLLLNDSPIFYGNAGFNNNGFDQCSNYFDFERKKLRFNLKYTTSYFAGNLWFIDETRKEEFVSLCETDIFYGLVGNSKNLKGHFIQHNGKLKVILSEQIALTSEMKPFTNLWSSSWNGNQDSEFVLVFELPLYKFLSLEKESFGQNHLERQ